MLRSVSVVPPVGSPAVTCWFNAVTLPCTTAGVPPLPRALPIATIRSPMLTSAGLPKVTVGRFETPSIWSNATSSATSYPTTCASCVLPVPPMSTLMSVESAITWLFVMTSPLAEITMPVPAARPCVVVVVMFTTAGMTLFAIALASRLPERVPEPDPLPEPLPVPWPGVNTGAGAVARCGLRLWSTATATSAPMPADASTSAMAAMTAAMRVDADGREGGAGHPPAGAGGAAPPGGPGGGGVWGQLGGVWGGQAE